jgi:hypothetical protein
MHELSVGYLLLTVDVTLIKVKALASSYGMPAAFLFLDRVLYSASNYNFAILKYS